MCGAPGASVGAKTRQWGVESRQGAENSALKNIAPFNRTPFNTSENASNPPASSGRRAKFRGARAKHSKPTGLAGKKFNPSRAWSVVVADGSYNTPFST
jgi:hypothetical protein